MNKPKHTDKSGKTRLSETQNNIIPLKIKGRICVGTFGQTDFRARGSVRFVNHSESIGYVSDISDPLKGGRKPVRKSQVSPPSPFGAAPETPESVLPAAIEAKLDDIEAVLQSLAGTLERRLGTGAPEAVTIAQALLEFRRHRAALRNNEPAPGAAQKGNP